MSTNGLTGASRMVPRYITSPAEEVNLAALSLAVSTAAAQTVREYPIDRQHLDPFLYRLIAAAGNAPGCFVIFAAGEMPNSDASWRDLGRHTRVVENGPDAFDRMVASIEELGRTPGLNLYVSIGLFKPRNEW